MSSHLDSSRPIRLACAGAAWSLGLGLGALWSGEPAPQRLLGTAVVVAAAVLLASVVGPLVWVRWAYDGFCARLAAGSSELAEQRVVVQRVPGRVVRWRRVAAYPSWSTATPDPVPAPSSVLVVTVLTDEGTRRVAALVPASSLFEHRGRPVLVRVHPRLQDVALVDVTAGPDAVAAGEREPRWERAPLSPDRVLAGRQLLLLGAGVAGFGLGLLSAALLAVSLG